MFDFYNKDSLKILFEWETMSLDELKKLSENISIKMLRWIAMIHPDNKTRENLLRFSKLNIGEKTVINIGINVYSNEEYIIKIGKRCAIAANVAFITESGPNMSKLNNYDIVKKRYIKKGKIIVEDDVWIGHGVIIFPGIKIGKCSIVGAGSIINKDLEAYSVFKGQPALKIKDLRSQ